MHILATAAPKPATGKPVSVSMFVKRFQQFHCNVRTHLKWSEVSFAIHPWLLLEYTILKGKLIRLTELFTRSVYFRCDCDCHFNVCYFVLEVPSKKMGHSDFENMSMINDQWPGCANYTIHHFHTRTHAPCSRPDILWMRIIGHKIMQLNGNKWDFVMNSEHISKVENEWHGRLCNVHVRQLWRFFGEKKIVNT